MPTINTAESIAAALPDVITELRDAQGLTAADLAKLAQTDRRHIEKIESGLHTPGYLCSAGLLQRWGSRQALC